MPIGLEEFMSYRRLFTLLAIIALPLCSFGCATSRPALSPEIRDQLGNIGIVSAKYPPEVSMSAPAKGPVAGLGIGAASGSLDVLGALSGGKEIGAILSVILVPVGAVVGGIHGAAVAESSEKVETAEAVLMRAIEACMSQEIMSHDLCAVAKSRTGRSFIEIKDYGPSVPDEQPDYSRLANNDIQTVIEITVLQYGLMKAPPLEVNPPLSFFINARARVVKTADGSVLYSNTFKYKSTKLAQSDWAADNARRFRNKWENAFSILSERIVEALFELPE
jgi:hypothetical protein